jgi:integrase
MKQDPNRYPITTIQTMLQNNKQETSEIIALTYATGSRISELIQIVPEDITIENNYLQIICPVLKKRKQTNFKRIALVRIDETWLTQPILNLCKKTKPLTPLITHNRFKLFRIIKEATGLNPHMFRAIRASHLVKIHKFNGHQLKHFFGWSSVSPSDFYVSLNTDDIKY